MESILNGILYGLVLAVLVGPIFFTLVQTSIERGFWSGFFVAVGVSLSDMFYITISYLGVYQLFDQGNFKAYLAYVGGGVLVAMGVNYLFIKNRKRVEVRAEKIQVRSPLKLMVKGFLVNGLTPTVFIFWLGTVGIAATKFEYVTPGKAIPFFVAIVCTVFTTDVLKAKLADQLGRLLTPRFIRTMNVILGIAFVVFGGRLIVMALIPNMNTIF
jgi:threonine/homoserine/homoserine lactone efflux protein